MTRPNPLARLLLLLLTLAATPAMPVDWEAFPTREAKLVLVAPGLEAPVVIFRRASEGLQVFELGHWRPVSREFPEAKLIVLRISSAAPPGFTFRREPPLEERAKSWIRSDRIEAGAGGKFRNVLGELEYQRFTRNGTTECVFMRQYGDTYSDQRGYFSDGSMGHGNVMIRGYYCVAPGERLSDSTLRGFLAGIGLKDFAVPHAYRIKEEAALAAAASRQQTSSRSGAYADTVRFTSMVYRTSNGQQLADELQQVSLDHGRVYVYVKWRGLTQSLHVAQLRVFDGAGRQVKTSRYEFTPTSTEWNTWWSYNISPVLDQAGNWRFEIDMDGERLVDRVLVVTPLGQTSARSGTTEASGDTAFLQYQNLDEAPKYKAFVRDANGAWAWRIRESFYSAQLEALQLCQDRAREVGEPDGCRIYAAGNDVVWDIPQKERGSIIEAYKK